MSAQKSLKRITDPDYLLCHRCGRRLEGTAHRKCAEAALKEQAGRGVSKIKHAVSTRPYEGAGTIGHSPCRLDDGSVIIPAEEARKVREEGFVCELTGTRYGPWTGGRLRERSRVQSKQKTEEIIEEIEEELDLCEDDEKEDLFSLIYGYSSKVYLANLFMSDILIEIPDE